MSTEAKSDKVKYLARSADQKAGIPPQLYEDHVMGVFNGCRTRLSDMEKFCPDKELFQAMKVALLLAAEYHDLGKLDAQAAEVLGGRSEAKLINHVDAGVAFLLREHQKSGALEFLLAAVFVHSHHIGLVNQEDVLEESISGLMTKINPKPKIRDNKSCEVYSLSEDATVKDRVDRSLEIYLERHRSLVGNLNEKSTVNQLACSRGLKNFLVVKMFLSVLCDSDHEDAAHHSGEPYPERRIPLNARKRLDSLVDKIAALPKTARQDARNSLLDSCLHCSTSGSAFVLEGTVGTGKTIGQAAFGLRVCETAAMRGIFYVLPYIALIDQSEGVYRDMLSLSPKDSQWSFNAVHSLFPSLSLFQRRYVRGYNAPVNLTTSVNFFESITSNHTSAFRNIHKIAGTLICIDEYHAIADYEFWPTILKILDDLCRYFGCKVVLSSGTPTRFWEIDEIASILPADSCFSSIKSIICAEDYQSMLAKEEERVKIIWKTNKEMSFASLCGEVESLSGSVFAIFNTTRKAEEFVRYMKGHSEREVYLRYSRLAPKDRKLQLEIIKTKMLEGTPILLVATQGSDIGLDLSFHHGLKEFSSFDSILQLLGRVNRSCEFSDSKAVVFKLVPDPLKNGEELKENPGLLHKIRALDDSQEVRGVANPASCTAIAQKEITQLSASKQASMSQLQANLELRQFSSLADNFSLIALPTIRILTDVDIFRTIMRGDKVPWHQMQNATVNMIRSERNMGRIEHLLFPIYVDAETGKCSQSPPECETEEEELSPDFYFWLGGYDNENFGISVGVESGVAERQYIIDDLMLV